VASHPTAPRSSPQFPTAEVRREKRLLPLTESLLGFLAPFDANLRRAVQEEVRESISEITEHVVHADASAAEGPDHLQVPPNGPSLPREQAAQYFPQGAAN